VFHSHALPEADRLAEQALPEAVLAVPPVLSSAGMAVFHSHALPEADRLAEQALPEAVLAVPPVLSSAGMAVFHSPAPLVHRAAWPSRTCTDCPGC